MHFPNYLQKKFQAHSSFQGTRKRELWQLTSHMKCQNIKKNITQKFSVSSEWINLPTGPVSVPLLFLNRSSTYLARSSPARRLLTHSCNVSKVTIYNTTSLSGTEPKTLRTNAAWIAFRITDHWHLFLAFKFSNARSTGRLTSKYLHQSHWTERMLTSWGSSNHNYYLIRDVTNPASHVCVCADVNANNEDFFLNVLA